MRSSWKLAVPVLFVIAIGGIAIAWQAYEAHLSELKCVDVARMRRQRAEQGDVIAQSDLANMYYKGQGMSLDYAEALRWYRKAADQGNAEGQRGVGLIYYHGQGVPQDYAEALRWYRKSADQGDEKAEDGIGLMFYHGQGVPQDYAEALRWYQKAAEQGYAQAQYNLGYMYWSGRGMPQNRAEAVKWYRKAADQGDRYALRALSREPSIFTKVLLVGELLGGILLVYFVSFAHQLSIEGDRIFRPRVIALFGTLLAFHAELLWYGYTHYMIRSPGYGASAFTLVRWLLNAVLIALLFYIIAHKGIRTTRVN